MATAGEKIYEWDKQPRMPIPTPPRGSCDCQFHLYDDPAKFPPRPNPPYPPIESATFTEAQRMHKAIGFDRGVIVHSAIYGSDHRLLLHALENLNDRDRYRGIGIVDDRVTDRELERMHAAGVRGARFNFVRFLILDQREAEIRRSMARLSELGWHARLHVNGQDLLDNSDLLRSLKDVPMVIDHFGHVGFEGGLDRPVIRWVLDMLKQDNWWVMVSNGNRDSKMDEGWDDAIPQGIHRGGARPHHLGHRLAPSPVDQADDERRRGSRAALPLRRRRRNVAAQDPGGQSCEVTWI
jgi:2-pyrone-4,6-dicarboxylate lactonase